MPPIVVDELVFVCCAPSESKQTILMGKKDRTNLRHCTAHQRVNFAVLQLEKKRIFPHAFCLILRIWAAPVTEPIFDEQLFDAFVCVI